MIGEGHTRCRPSNACPYHAHTHRAFSPITVSAFVPNVFLPVRLTGQSLRKLLDCGMQGQAMTPLVPHPIFFSGLSESVPPARL